MGVRLEDRSAETCIKLVDRETLLREQEQKKAIEAAKEEVIAKYLDIDDMVILSFAALYSNI